MDYKNIFENYGIIKNKINKLLGAIDRSYIKNELDNIKDIYIKKVVKCQYLYVLQKEMNLLKNNKSQLIIELEYNLKKIEKMENIKDIMKILNKLGYVDLLLLILNINENVLKKIKNETGNNSIEYNLLDIHNSKNQEEHLENLINRITNNIFDKYNETNSNSSNNINIIYKNKKNIYEEEDEETNEEEDEDEDEEEENKKINLDIKKDMKLLIPTVIEKEEKIEKNEKDEEGNKIEEIISQKMILSKDDMELLNNL
jgi:hypothetical protein